MVFSCEEGGRRIKKHKKGQLFKGCPWETVWGSQAKLETMLLCSKICVGDMEKSDTVTQSDCGRKMYTVVWVAMETTVTYSTPAAFSLDLFWVTFAQEQSVVVTTMQFRLNMCFSFTNSLKTALCHIVKAMSNSFKVVWQVFPKRLRRQTAHSVSSYTEIWFMDTLGTSKLNDTNLLSGCFSEDESLLHTYNIWWESF